MPLLHFSRICRATGTVSLFLEFLLSKVCACVKPRWLTGVYCSEYDFFLFNTQKQNGTVTITAKVSPSLNTLGDNRPMALALQVDDGATETVHFVPPAKPGTLPAGWGGKDGWVANSIIDVPFVFPVQPGAHTLKVRITELSMP